jgi:hypothetical protein
MLHEFLVNKRLFLRSSETETARAVSLLEIPPIRSARPDVSIHLERITFQALERAPTARQPSASDLADELDSVVRDAGGVFSTPAAVAGYLKAYHPTLLPNPPAPLVKPPTWARVEHEQPPGRMTILVPSPEQPCEVALADGRTALVESVELSSHFTSRQRSFSFLGDDVLPAPLILSPAAGSLRIGYQHDGTSRTSFYADATDPASRREEIRISSMTDMHLDFGHRTTRLQRLFCDSRTRDAPTSPLYVDVQRLGATFVSKGDVRQLTILHTTDETTGVVHVVCIRLS